MLNHPEKANLPKDESLIPKGTHYCYIGDKVCPYHDRDDSKPEQEQGYCHFLKLGDWMEEGTMLLWDACKECGIGHEEN